MKRFIKNAIFIMSIVCILAIPFLATAHDGPVDKDGCHQDGEGRTHCH